MSQPQKRRTFLMLDPYDSYGVEIARYATQSLGIRPIAIFADPKMRAYFRSEFPEIESDLFVEQVDIGSRSLTDVALALRERYDIVGVAPYLEFHLEKFAPVVSALGLTWNDSEALARVRDKHAIIQWLHAKGVPAPESFSVATIEEALEAQSRFGRFVLKPNAGYSNQNVGFFGPETTREELVQHLDVDCGLAPGFIAEEYIGGLEFSLNGQVDEEGTPHVFAILLGDRTTANGRESVYRHEWRFPTDDPLYETLAEYARDVMRAVGLRSIPFHLEARLDDNGIPKLIDIGARPVGNEVAFAIGRMHSGRLNMLHLACRGYLGMDCTPPGYDWEHYDAVTFVRLYGISRIDGIIATVEGIEETEARPEFFRWVIKPTIGKKIVPTLDLNTLPYLVDFHVDGDVALARQIATEVEEAVRWNTPSPSLGEKAEALRLHLKHRIKPRARMFYEGLGRDAAPSIELHASSAGRGSVDVDSEGDSSAPQPRDPRPADLSDTDRTSRSSVPESAKGGLKQGLKHGLKEGLWPALRHVVTRNPPPPLDGWDLTTGENGRLLYEGVDIAGLCDRFGSPLYVVLDGVLRKNVRAFQSASRGANVDVAFSYKTNPVPGVCARLNALGVGAECISPYELWLALELGVDPAKIIYGGPAKSDASLELAIDREIRLLNINHPEEIERVERAARKVGKSARVGLRVTPPGGWTGQFGASISDGEAMPMFERAMASNVLDVVGLHVHRGMLLRDLDTIDNYLDAVLDFATKLVRDLDVPLSLLDVGGSLAIPTVASFSKSERRLSQTFLADLPAPNPADTVSIETYVDRVATKTEAAFAEQGLAVPTVVLEPGRAMTGNAQLLLTSVVTTKDGAHPPAHAVLDGGINIAEPAQFEYHRAVCANRATAPDEKMWRLVGPACTPGDVLYSAWGGPSLREGDVIAILDAGAYFVPFSTTFSFPRPGIVSIVDGSVESMRRSETFEDLVTRDGPAFSPSADAEASQGVGVPPANVVDVSTARGGR